MYSYLQASDTQPLFSQLFISVNNIVSSWSVGNHGDRVSDLLLDEFDVFSAILRKILIVLYSTDIAFPSWKLLDHRFCFLKSGCGREVCSNLSVDIVSNTNRDLIQIAKYVKYCKCHICSTLKTAAVFRCNTVIPSHTSRTSSGSAVFSAITTASSKLVSLFSENLGNKCTGTYCAGISLAYNNNLLEAHLLRLHHMLPVWKKR